jgi:hypothetical protein
MTTDSAARPEIVCLCGSTRFIDEFRRQNLRLTIEGKIVVSIGCDTKSDDELFDPDCDHGGGPAARCGYCDSAAVKANLDELHKRKIDLADRVLVLNVAGYIGESTRSEIDYATALGKPIDYLEALPRTHRLRRAARVDGAHTTTRTAR